MTTRRTMVWLILFILTLPTVAAAADTAQRASEQGIVVRLGSLHEGERFVYDLHFSSHRHDVDTTVKDWFTVEVGSVGDHTSPDGTTARALPVTITREVAPWPEGGEGTETRQRQVTTEYYRIPDGVLLSRTQAYDGEMWTERDGELERTAMQRTIERTAAYVGGSFFGRGEYPGASYVNGNLLATIAMAFLDPHAGEVTEVAEWKGETVYNVGGRTWEAEREVFVFACNPDHPEVHYNDWTGEDHGVLHQETGYDTWIRDGLALPAQSGCHSRYTRAAGLVEEVRLTLDLVDHASGGDAVPIAWDREAEAATTAKVFGDPAPVSLPGVPQDGDEPLRLPLAEVVRAVQETDEPTVRAFRGAGEVPFMVTEATYLPYRDLRRSTVQDGLPDLPTLPLPPSSDEGSKSTPASSSTWNVILQNLDGDMLRVGHTRSFDADGEALDDTLDVGEVAPADTPLDPDDFPSHAVPVADLFAAWRDLESVSLADWQEDEQARMSIASRFWFDLAAGEIRASRHDVEFYQSGTNETAWTGGREMIRRASFNGETGALNERDTTVYTARDNTPPPRMSMRPATTEAKTLPQPYIPAAATASALGVALAFAVAYFWDPLARTSAQVLVAPMYAKIRKDKVLDHRTRDQIVEYVRVNPGAPLGAVRKELEVGYGTAVHHLNTLERNGLLKSRKVGRTRCYFLPGILGPGQMDAVGASATGAAGRFLTVVAATPGLTQREVAERLGVTDASVRYQAKRLVDHGLVRAVRDGRVVRYFAATGDHAAAGSPQKGAEALA